LLLRSPSGEEMLAPAKAFVGLKGIRRMRGKQEVVYVSLMLARHEILDVSGLAAESFLPGPQACLNLSSRELLEIARVTAKKGGRKPPSQMIAARRCIGGAAGRRALMAGAQPALFRQTVSTASVSRCSDSRSTRNVAVQSLPLDTWVTVAKAAIHSGAAQAHFIRE
jgi:hypothetical protein